MKTLAQPNSAGYQQDSGCYISPDGCAQFFCPVSESRDILWDSERFNTLNNVAAATSVFSSPALAMGLYLINWKVACEINDALKPVGLRLLINATTIDFLTSGNGGPSDSNTLLARLPANGQIIVMTGTQLIGAAETAALMVRWKFLSR